MSQSERNDILSDMISVGWKDYLVCSSFNPKMKDGKVDKNFVHLYNWRDIEKRKMGWNEKATGFALVCGKEANISVIDIDDPELEHNKELINMGYEDSNCVVKTNKGFHFYFQFNPLLKQTQGEKIHKLDIRSEGGMIYSPPGEYRHPETKKMIRYIWELRPKDLGEYKLRECSERIIEFLRKLGGTRYINDPKPIASGAGDDADEEEGNEEDETTDPGEAFGVECDSVLVKLLNMTSKKRFDHYGDWMKIAIICKNENIPIENLIEASRKSKFWKSESPSWITKQFKTIKGKRSKPITQATLWMWLREDNYEAFKTLNTERNDFLRIVPILNHNDCAKFFVGMFPDDYVYNDKLGWYVLNRETNIWESSDGIPGDLFNRVSDTMMRLMRDEIEGLSNRLNKNIEKYSADASKIEEVRKEHQSKMKLYISTLRVLGSKDFTNGIISFCKSLYHNADLEKLMNECRTLFAFKNGKCVELETGKVRDIQPDDYVSINCGYDYPEKRNQVIEKQIQKTINTMFEDEEMVDYLLNAFASCLYGNNRFEVFYFLYGYGANGKGVIGDLLKTTFGGYYCTAPGQLLTNVSKAQDAPNPVLVKNRHGRIMMTTEPEEGKKLNADLLKQLTGNDVVDARALHKDIISCVPHYTPFIQTNTLPGFVGTTAGMDRRVRVIHFPFQFVSSPSLPNERKRDIKLKDIVKTKEWRDSFIMILLDKVKEINEMDNIHIPEKAKDAGAIYLSDNNPIGTWLKDNYKFGGGGRMKVKELVDDFRQADIEGFGVDKLLKILKRELLRIGCSQIKSHGTMMYVGIDRKEKEEEEEENEECMME